MDRNFALFHLAMARPSDAAPSRGSSLAPALILVVGIAVIAAVAISFISG